MDEMIESKLLSISLWDHSHFFRARIMQRNAATLKPSAAATYCSVERLSIALLFVRLPKRSSYYIQHLVDQRQMLMSILTQLIYTRAHVPVSAGAHYANARVCVHARNKFVKSQAATAPGLHSAVDSHFHRGAR